MKEKLLFKAGVETCPIAIIVKDEKVLTGHRHYTKEKWKDISVWTVPGGRCEVGETLEETLRREVFEEVGINDLNIIDFIGDMPGAKEGDTISIFFCTTDQEAKLMEPEKFSEWRWVPINEFINDKTYDGFNRPAKQLVNNYLSNLRG